MKTINPETFNNYRDATKPLQIPPNFNSDGPIVEQVIFTLAYLMEGTIQDVANKLVELNTSLSLADAEVYSKIVLEKLHDLTKVNAMHVHGKLKYHLHKEVVSHEGKVDPDK